MSNINALLRDKRKEKGLTMREVAEAVGVSEATVSRWESGNIANMGRSKIAALSKILDLTPAEIMGIEDQPNKSKPNDREFIPVEYNPTHKIPVLGRISAGLPLYAEENIEDYIYTELNGGNEYFGLRVVGDSMNAARICEGDIIIVRQQEQVEDGEIAVVMVGDDDATVKRFHQNGRTVTLTPQSYNPAHQVQVYDLKETNIRIVGKVVQVIYRME